MRGLLLTQGRARKQLWWHRTSLFYSHAPLFSHACCYYPTLLFCCLPHHFCPPLALTIARLQEFPSAFPRRLVKCALPWQQPCSLEDNAGNISHWPLCAGCQPPAMEPVAPWLSCGSPGTCLVRPGCWAAFTDWGGWGGSPSSPRVLPGVPISPPRELHVATSGFSSRSCHRCPWYVKAVELYSAFPHLPSCTDSSGCSHMFLSVH